MRKTRRSQAQDRATADQAYLEQVRGDQASAPAPHGAQPVPVPDGGVQTTEMPYVPTAAPSPVLGVSPILGESATSSPPPVGSFTAPPVGPPAPAYASQSGAHQAPSVVDQNPLDLHKANVHQANVHQANVHQANLHQGNVPEANVATMSGPRPFPPYGGQQPLLGGGLDLPLLLGPGGVAPPGDLVTCPECGEMATVDAARRNSEDFCRNCDFPLFWARSTVVLPSGEETGASLRRLPGTVGRAATAALMCPHCGEPNSPAAQNCVRCLLSLHPVEVVAAPVFVPPPEPEPMPVPIGRYYPLWWILLVSACLLAIVLIVVWVAVN